GDVCSCAVGGVGSGSCARTLGELDPVGVSEPSGDVASGAVGGVGSGSCARALGELDPVGVSGFLANSAVWFRLLPPPIHTATCLLCGIGGTVAYMLSVI